MSVYRFATLLTQDAAGFYTAVPVEADDDATAGFATSPTQALQQLREYLTWLYQRGGGPPAPELVEAHLGTFKVSVRPEYRVENRIHACDEMVLPVHCVHGKLAGGLLVAALPLLGVRF